jgi:hypothetical protein
MIPTTKACAHCGAAFSKPHSSWRQWAGRKFCSDPCAREARWGDRSTRFWSMVAKGEGCWLWTGEVLHNGYGRIYHADGHKEAAHRVAWRLVNGPIPADLSVCHHCDNPPCVRPDHLFLGTHADNMRDKVSKGRQARGERSGTAVLTTAQVVAIRVRHAGGDSPEQLSTEYGVAPSTIRNITSRRRWRHVA